MGDRRRGRRGGGGPLGLRRVRSHDRAGPCCPARPGDRGAYPGPHGRPGASSDPRWARRRRWRRPLRCPPRSHLAHRLSPARGTSRSRRSRQHAGRPRAGRRRALITPWNWPLNQIACKVAPALAAGCTMVPPSRPSSRRLNALIFAEILGRGRRRRPEVFNLVNGQRPDVGLTDERRTRRSTWSRSPARPGPASTVAAARGAVGQGSPRARRQVGQHRPRRRRSDAVVRRRHLGVQQPGQSCNAPPSRMLVPRTRWKGGGEVAKADVAGSIRAGDPADGRRPSVRWSIADASGTRSRR